MAITIARHKQVCLEVTPVYHCVTRRVRRSFLCGYNKLTRKNYDHRRAWIEERPAAVALLLLAEVFCIEIADYSVMSNHYHVLLHVDKAKADNLSDDEVIERSLKLYREPELVQRNAVGESLSRQELCQLCKQVTQWREELSNISRFMGNLNEYIARTANKEDNCKGRFWEGRFKLQAVLDVAALLQTLCYVDLNPVRAKIAKTPEISKYTSVRRRLHQRKTGLMKFNANQDKGASTGLSALDGLPITFKQYLELLDWTGRQIRKGKRGHIDQISPSIMTRLGFTAKKWLKTQTPQVSWTQKALGTAESIKDFSIRHHQQLPGIHPRPLPLCQVQALC